MEKRLENLEAAFGGPSGCPSCGGGGGRLVRFIFAGALGPSEEFEQQYYDRCGRPLNFTMRLGETDLPPRGEVEGVLDD